MTRDELVAKIEALRLLKDEVQAINFGIADKDTFKNELVYLTNCVVADEIPTVPEEFRQLESIVQIISQWCELMKDSVGYRLCDEMSFCIVKLISKWDKKAHEKFVVFTLGDYAINKLKRNKVSKLFDVLIVVSLKYQVSFTKEPVFIRVPDEFKDGVLSNIVLFHEVGHFVDFDNAISEYVSDDVENEINGKPSARILRDYFPSFFNKPFDATTKGKIAIYVSEYVADVFGCIYAGSHILNYLSYLEGNKPKRESETHPSYLCRKKMVDSFIAYCKYGDTIDNLLSYILNAINSIFNTSIGIVDSNKKEEDFLSGTYMIADVDDMFTLFIKPWDMIIRERTNKKLGRVSKEEYKKLMEMDLYKTLDENMRLSIRELMKR